MTAITVPLGKFSGNSKVYSADVDGLAAIIRGLAIDNAIAKLQVSGVSAVTDDTTGTPAASMGGGGMSLIAPSGIFNASSAGGVLTTALATSIAKFKNATQGWVSVLNNCLARLGLPNLEYGEGALGTFGTIVAQDLSNTTGAGDLAVSYASYTATATVMLSNQYNLMLAMNQILAAIGFPKIISSFGGPWAANSALQLIPAPVDSSASTPGTDSVKLADGTALMAALADNFATLATVYNEAMNQGATPGTLTDSTGGSSGGLTVPELVVVAPVGYTDVSGASLPTAAGNTLLGVYRNAFSSVLAKINLYREKNGLAPLTDNVGGTVSTTLAAESDSLSAVAGAIQAQGTITESTTLNFINGDVLTIGNQEFTFVTTLGTTPGTIQVRADTNAGFLLSMGDVINAMAAAGQGVGGLVASTYVPNSGAAADTLVSFIQNAGSSGATYLVTALADGVGGNSLVFTYANAGTAGVTIDGSGTLGSTTAGANSLAASLTTWEASLTAIGNNVAFLTAQLNVVVGDVGGDVGLQPLIDDSGGVNTGATVAVPALITANNRVAAVGVKNSLADTIEGAIRNAVATLAARVNALAGDNWGVGLHVVAA